MKKTEVKSDVTKWDKAGQTIVGTLVSIDKSTSFDDSWAVKIKEADKASSTVVFANNLLKSRLEEAGIGSLVEIEYLGKRKAQDGKFEYNDFKVYRVTDE